MERKNRRFPIVMIVLMLLSLTCNMPLGKNAGGSKTAEPESIEIVDQQVYTSDAAAHAANLFSHPETADLLASVQSEGYTDLVESGDFTYSNGGKMHAVSLTNGDSLVAIMQIETAAGSLDAMIVEFIEKNSILYRDKSGSIKVMVNDEGELSYIIFDAAGNPVSVNDVKKSNSYKQASIIPQDVNTCTDGMGFDFAECMNRKYEELETEGTVYLGEICTASLIAAEATCFVPPFADCVIVIAAVLASCMYGYADCMWEMTDDPPTFDYSEAKMVEPIAYCQEDTLFKDNLYQVQVECKDDRQPKPANLTVNMTSGEAKEFTCTDCSGQSSSGTIPPPGEVSSLICDYGCLAVGDGKDRCLNEGETPSSGMSGESENSETLSLEECDARSYTEITPAITQEENDCASGYHLTITNNHSSDTIVIIPHFSGRTDETTENAWYPDLADRIGPGVSITDAGKGFNLEKWGGFYSTCAMRDGQLSFPVYFFTDRVAVIKAIDGCEWITGESDLDLLSIQLPNYVEE